jgi:hypothetical protein
MFKRKTAEIDLLNLFNIVENKIDILNSKFEAITFLDGCCECKKRESKIYEMLVDYFEMKFLNFNSHEEKILLKQDLQDFKTNLLLELKNMCALSENDHLNLKEMIKEVLDNQNNLKLPERIDHQEYHIKHESGLTNLGLNITNLIETSSNLDKKLRSDLQSFLLNLQTNIIKDLKSEFNNQMKEMDNNNNDNVADIQSSLHQIDAKVDGFYFENELVKHQLTLEEEIRKYNDDIDSLKLIINNTTSEIDKIFKHFNYNE